MVCCDRSRYFVWLEVFLGIIVFLLLYFEILNPLLVAGTLLITSPVLNEKFLVSEMAYWVGVQVFRPRWRYNPYLWGGIIFLSGVEVARRTADVSLASWANSDPSSFWIILLILLINLFAGYFIKKS